MSNHDDERAEPLGGISDEQLPEDLRPTDDNPLAQPLSDEDDSTSPEELDVLGGKTPEQPDDSDDSDDSDGESGGESQG